MHLRRARYSIALACLVGCSSDLVALSDSGSESESDGSVPDMPAEPACPAQLGDAVTCECAVVEGCEIPNADPSTGCTLVCDDIPAPCPTVNCSFEGSTSWPTCEEDLDVVALQCVFDALAEGQPMRWTTQRFDSSTQYMSPGFLESTREFLRLDETTYAHYSGKWVDHFHADGEDSWSFAGLEIAATAWMECDAEATDYERFNCLHELGSAGESCADPSALICP